MTTEAMITVLITHETARLHRAFPLNDNEYRLLQYKDFLTDATTEELIAEFESTMACLLS